MTAFAYGDALDAILTYMKDMDHKGDLDDHLPRIVDQYMPASVPWADLSKAQRSAVQRSWKYLWALASEAPRTLFEPDGDGKRADMVQIFPGEVKVLEIKGTDTRAARQKSAAQVRDTIEALQARLGVARVFTAHRLTFFALEREPFYRVEWHAFTAPV